MCMRTRVLLEEQFKKISIDADLEVGMIYFKLKIRKVVTYVIY